MVGVACATPDQANPPQPHPNWLPEPRLLWQVSQPSAATVAAEAAQPEPVTWDHAQWLQQFQTTGEYEVCGGACFPYPSVDPMSPSMFVNPVPPTTPTNLTTAATHTNAPNYQNGYPSPGRPRLASPSIPVSGLTH